MGVSCLALNPDETESSSSQTPYKLTYKDLLPSPEKYLQVKVLLSTGHQEAALCLFIQQTCLLQVSVVCPPCLHLASHQIVQNIAAKTVAGSQQFSHITPVLSSLRRLLIDFPSPRDLCERC
ncbi:hypothetical protein Z043_111982, partial [Scleropages formosus]